MALQAEQIADLITTTLKDLGRLKWTDLTSTLRRYIAMPKLVREKKVSFESGTGIQWNVQIGTSGAAKNTGLFATDNVNVADTMHTASIPWRHNNTNYAFDEREILMNRDPARIVELVRTRRHDAMVDYAKLWETNFWNKPVDSTDTLKPFGVPYWIVKNATEGLTGGDPSGFTAGAGGLASATYDQWKNWSAQYVNTTKDDLVRKVRKAMEYTMFQAPVASPPGYEDGMGQGLYSNYDVIKVLEELLESQNDNLGNDVASKDGKVVIRGTPLEHAFFLDDDTSNPIYGIDWSVFKPVCLSGMYMKEYGPTIVPGQHLVYQVHVDTTMNYKCTNRRVNFVVYK